jgi:hypothetical protein
VVTVVVWAGLVVVVVADVSHAVRINALATTMAMMITRYLFMSPPYFSLFMASAELPSSGQLIEKRIVLTDDLKETNYTIGSHSNIYFWNYSSLI